MVCIMDRAFSQQAFTFLVYSPFFIHSGLGNKRTVELVSTWDMFLLSFVLKVQRALRMVKSVFFRHKLHMLSCFFSYFLGSLQYHYSSLLWQWCGWTWHQMRIWKEKKNIFWLRTIVKMLRKEEVKQESVDTCVFRLLKF